MTHPHPRFIVSGNDPPQEVDVDLRLNYRKDLRGRNIRLALPPLARLLGHIPDRTLDLLEIAAYVYGADRYSSRGDTAAVEYSAWGREFIFHIRVRDWNFWSKRAVQDKLSRALEFVTGDRLYQFVFHKGHYTQPANIFDGADFLPLETSPRSVALFSGGLDSLAGVVELLQETDDPILLVSHQPRPGTTRTQNALVAALSSSYPGRVCHYPFGCNLTSVRAREETQRSRSFLYTSVAFAVAEAFGLRRFFVFENGVTSINLARRQDLMNARASRTTHPQSIARFGSFFSEVAGATVSISAPYLFKTKTDVVKSLVDGAHTKLIPSSVSCSRTYRSMVNATHCGECFQCLDRRLAAYAANAQDLDHSGLYAHDVIGACFSSREAKTTAVDYIRQAVRLSSIGCDEFYDEYLTELAEVIEFSPSVEPEMKQIEDLWQLFRRHGDEVLGALEHIRTLHDDLRSTIPPNSVLGVVSRREYLQPAVRRLVTSVSEIVRRTVPDMFRGRPPQDEPDFNKKLAALIKSHWPDLRSEHPSVSFACARVIPDHELPANDLLIEAKYIRNNTPPSKASEGIAADLTKYPDNAHVLFVVLDLGCRINNDLIFQQDFEAKGRCTVLILR